MAAVNIPSAWADAEVLDGMMIVDKAELVGKPLRLTAAYFRVNKRQVSILEVDGELVDGTTFTFTDSSSGVRKQVIAHLESKSVTVSDTSGEVYPLNIIAPEGLRVSVFDIEDSVTGKPGKGRTYYLTTSGERGSSERGNEPTRPATRTRTAAK